MRLVKVTVSGHQWLPITPAIGLGQEKTRHVDRGPDGYSVWTNYYLVPHGLVATVDDATHAAAFGRRSHEQLLTDVTPEQVRQYVPGPEYHMIDTTVIATVETVTEHFPQLLPHLPTEPDVPAWTCRDAYPASWKPSTVFAAYEQWCAAVSETEGR